MVIKMTMRKASWVRFILVTGAFLLLLPLTRAQQYNYDANCEHAYASILSLRFLEARQMIALEKKAVPGNLLPLYLDNYIDFLTLVIGEERNVYNQLKDKKGERITNLEKGPRDSPFYNFCLGEVHMQWAFARLKFGDYGTAAFEIRKAYGYFSANEQRYPSFIINKMGLGMLHVIVSLVPENFKWVSTLVGLKGDMELGLNEIRQVAGYPGPDKITRLYKPEASFFLAFLAVNLQKNKRDAMPVLDLLKSQRDGDQTLESPLLIYARASVLMKNGFNDEALVALQERSSLAPSFNFYYLDYLEGMARLNKLDYRASAYFERFLAGFRGRNYIRSAYQKLAWIAILGGDTAGYYRKIRLALTRGEAVVDEDRQAGFEAVSDVAPNLMLLRARLLFDGGYYNLALGVLLNNSLTTTLKSKRDLVEYTYRLGRTYHETGNFARAVEYYRQTVLNGKMEPWYFAAGAAYQMGLLFENKGAFSRADSAYRLCLSIKSPEYRTSLDQKARAGLNRLKTAQPKI